MSTTRKKPDLTHANTTWPFDLRAEQERPAKPTKVAPPVKKLYICVERGVEVTDDLTKAYRTYIDEGGNEDFDDCTFLEVKEIKVRQEIVPVVNILPK